MKNDSINRIIRVYNKHIQEQKKSYFATREYLYKLVIVIVAICESLNIQYILTDIVSNNTLEAVQIKLKHPKIIIRLRADNIMRISRYFGFLEKVIAYDTFNAASDQSLINIIDCFAYCITKGTIFYKNPCMIIDKIKQRQMFKSIDIGILKNKKYGNK